jgi:hypothetical protein
VRGQNTRKTGRVETSKPVPDTLMTRQHSWKAIVLIGFTRDIDLMTNAFIMSCLPEQKSACLDAALAPVQAALIKEKVDEVWN